MAQPPAFQFYASDYLSSSKVQRMSLEAEGAYIRLLAYNWQDGYIPADVSLLARMCKATTKKMAVLWDCYLRDCFQPSANDPDKLVNPRLEEVRLEQEAYRARKAAAGALGGTAKAKAKQEPSKIVAVLDSAKGSATDLLVAEGVAKLSPSSPSPVSNLQEKNPSDSLLPKNRKSSPPAEFSITDEMWEWATTNGFNRTTVERETAAMLDWAKGKGEKRLDWTATWRNWLRNHTKYGGKPNLQAVGHVHTKHCAWDTCSEMNREYREAVEKAATNAN